MVETVELLREWLEPRLDRYAVEYYINKDNLMITIGKHDASVGLYIRDAKIWIITSDEGTENVSIDLHDPNSLQKVLNAVLSTIRSTVPSVRITYEDHAVLVDMLTERLPMVWQDALEEVNRGDDIESVIESMDSGHILRILERLNYDTRWFTNEFREFAVGEDRCQEQ
jgi:hypothetical protein